MTRAPSGLADAVHALSADLITAVLRRAPTPDDLVHLDDVLDAAAEWDAGRLPLGAFATTGGLLARGTPSPGFTRFVAIQTAAADDPRRAALLRAVDAIIADQERRGLLRQTKHGTFTEGEMEAYRDWRRYGIRRKVTPE